MTKEEAMALCALFHENSFTYETGMGRAVSGEEFLNELREKFPSFNWRIIMDRSGTWTRWIVTVDDNDTREHYVPKSKSSNYPETCIHCGKTAQELGVEEREEYNRD